MSGKKGSYDIVIVGGGMIGTSLALALAPLGLRVAVVDAAPTSEPACGSVRHIVPVHSPWVSLVR